MSPHETTSLEGRVAIVTGGAVGLGRATAMTYARHSAKVVVGDVRRAEGQATADEIRSAGGTADFVKADVANDDDMRALVAAAENRFGRLDIMTANAAILGRGGWKSLEDLDLAEFENVMDVNFLGVVRAFKYAIPAIKRAGGGAMTATSSIAAHRGYAQRDAYVSSKAAIVGLVRSLAIELRPDVRVNAVSPGPMVTDMLLRSPGFAPAPGSAQAPLASDEGWRSADPLEVAKVHLFLVSDHSSYITGQTIVADGGRTLVVA
jgi:NAD(P)-dependent dehydrogenase (short-subunit alcohol dehydrogenase family)